MARPGSGRPVMFSTSRARICEGVGTRRNRETAGDIPRTGREAREGGAPDRGSFPGSSTRWFLFRYHNREEGPAGPSARLVSCLVKRTLPFGSGEFLNHPGRLTVPRRVRTQRTRVGTSSGLDVTPTPCLGNLLADVMRQRGGHLRSRACRTRAAPGGKRG